MTYKTELFTFEPIATIHTDVADEAVGKSRQHMISRIVLRPEYREAITGLGDYSHIFVLFWMDRVDRSGYENLARPRGRHDLPLTGCLASRGRQHPNPVGLAVAELLDIRDCELTVKRLDAYNGTPVIDIKPYDDYDIVQSPRVPDWWPGRRKAGTDSPV